MRLKKLKIQWTFICLAFMATYMTSCINNEPPSFYSYKASGLITDYQSSDDTLGVECAVSEYKDAIIAVFGDGLMERPADNAIKRVCNAVYQSHKRNHPSWKGYVEILRYEYDARGEKISTPVIAIYNYYESDE